MQIVGPFLRFGNVDVQNNVWSGSLLVLTRSDDSYQSSSKKTETSGAHLERLDSIESVSADQPNNASTEDVSMMKLELFFDVSNDSELSQLVPSVVLEDPLVLDRVGGWTFFRFDLCVSQPPSRHRRVAYRLCSGDEYLCDYVFHVPSVSTPFRFGFFSCNGYSHDGDEERSGGKKPMWDDLLNQHLAQPLFCLVGGGDQLYCDEIFSVPEVKEWLDTNGHDRKFVPYNQKLARAVETFYLNAYIDQFSFPEFKHTMAMIPTCFMLDDHDIFDGFGSYQPGLQNSPVIQGFGKEAYRFYLLFQQHTTPELARTKHGMFGCGGGYSFVKRFNRDMVMVALDTRAERTLDHVLSDQSWLEAKQQIESVCLDLPPKHLIFLAPIPLAYPRLKTVDKLNSFLRTCQKKGGSFVKKTCKVLHINQERPRRFLQSLRHRFKPMEGVIGHFGPELLDDILDHWTHETHLDERERILLFLQYLSTTYSVRTTFVSGDVHCASSGLFFSKSENVAEKALSSPADLCALTKNDPRAMFQITSSAITNVAPPPMVINMVQKNAKLLDFNENTQETMLRLFPSDVNGKEFKRNEGIVMGRRNWCTVDEVANVAGEIDLKCVIHVEKEDHSGCVGYALTVPPLIK